MNTYNEIIDECFISELFIRLDMMDDAVACLKKIERRYIGGLLISKRLLRGKDVGELNKLRSDERYIIASLIIGV